MTASNPYNPGEHDHKKHFPTTDVNVRALIQKQGAAATPRKKQTLNNPAYTDEKLQQIIKEPAPSCNEK